MGVTSFMIFIFLSGFILASLPSHLMPVLHFFPFTFMSPFQFLSLFFVSPL